MAANVPIEHTLSVIDFLKTQTDRVILFYSGGKDSLVLLDLLKGHFEVNLCFMYFVEGLIHVEKYIDYAQKKYSVKCNKYPHWMLCQYLNDNFYRFHEKGVSVIKLKDIEAKARQDFNCNWIITGMKQNDSLNRRLMLKQFFLEAVDLKGKRVHPLSKWNKNECLAYIKQKKLPMPIQYAKTNGSGVDLNKDCLSFLKKNYKDDYDKILKVFPFAETLLIEHGN